jgi:nucleotide-binding universal stress UspA family protein
MFRNAVVGVDGRPDGQDAIALAKRLLGKDGALALAYVHSGDPRVREVSPDFAAAERSRSRELLEAARSEAGVDAAMLSIGALSVGRGLHEIAERHGADLLVVGSWSRSLFGRVTLSDHTGEALNGASCAVAVAPTGYAEHPSLMSEIGVGFDGSPESELALATARELAGELGAKVSAFEAVSLLFGDRGNAATVERLVGDARARLAALGGVEPHAAFGEAAEELALYGASVDLLVVGSRSYGPIGRLVHGSTTRRLARTARCPLLVLTRAAQAPGTSTATHPGYEAHV